VNCSIHFIPCKQYFTKSTINDVNKSKQVFIVNSRVLNRLSTYYNHILYVIAGRIVRLYVYDIPSQKDDELLNFRRNWRGVGFRVKKRHIYADELQYYNIYIYIMCIIYVYYRSFLFKHK